jgi:hypothetical protein
MQHNRALPRFAHNAALCRVSRFGWYAVSGPCAVFIADGSPRILGMCSGAFPVTMAMRKGARHVRPNVDMVRIISGNAAVGRAGARTVKGFVAGLPGNAGAVFLIDRDGGTGLR